MVWNEESQVLLTLDGYTLFQNKLYEVDYNCIYGRWSNPYMPHSGPLHVVIRNMSHQKDFILVCERHLPLYTLPRFREYDME